MPTEALEALNRLPALKTLEGVAASIVITHADPDRGDSSVVYVNPAFEQMTGWSLAEIVGHPHRPLKSAPTDPFLPAELHECLKAGRIWRGRSASNRRNGQAYWLDWSISPLPGDRSYPGFFLSTLRDVTAEVEEALAKNEFWSMLTHELRGPLSLIIGYANLLCDPDVTDLAQVRHGASLIRQNGESLMETVEDILDHAKSGSGTIELAPVDLDLRFQLQEAISGLTPNAEMRGVTITLNAGDPVTVMADELRVGQILRNVIGNAVDHGREGGRVAINLSGDLDGATILVSDDGPGVPEEMRQRVFEPFVQLRSALNAPRRGVGLGLAIVRQFMELHGGNVEILPEYSGGATFKLWFPRNRDSGNVSLVGASGLTKNTSLKGATALSKLD